MPQCLSRGPPHTYLHSPRSLNERRDEKPVGKRGMGRRRVDFLVTGDVTAVHYSYGLSGPADRGACPANGTPETRSDKL